MLCTATAAILSLVEISAAYAHPVWVNGHTPEPDTVALFHFDAAGSASRQASIRTGVGLGTDATFLFNHGSLSASQNLEHYNFDDPSGGTMEFINEASSPELGLSSLGLTGNVRFRGVDIIEAANQNHFTIEAWLKWDDSNTSSDLRIGTGDRAIRIIRDNESPEKDAIGFQGSHGVWRPHPAFAGWDSLSVPVTDGQWFHVAMVIHNTGMHEHEGHWHYNDGSFCMIFVNGVLVGDGSAADRIDISEEDEDLVFHGSDRLAIWQTEGISRVLIDEFNVIQSDLTNGGNVITGLFEDGRGEVPAALIWNSPNIPTPDLVALYGFSAETSASLPATPRTGVLEGTMVTHQLNHPSLDQNLTLEHYNLAAATVGKMDLSGDVLTDVLAPASLALDGDIQFRGSEIIPDANMKDLTVEAWIKWDDFATSSDLRLGTGDRALRLIRNAADPSVDAIGLQGSHGVWRPHPGFTGWDQLPSAVSDGQWFHVAMVIHNTGMHDHEGHWHYNEGSFAMIFVNGKLIGQGTGADRIDISENYEDLVFHASDRIALWQTAGDSRILVDEFTIWQRYFTQGGTVLNGLFSDGRGGPAAVSGWTLYE